MAGSRASLISWRSLKIFRRPNVADPGCCCSSIARSEPLQAGEGHLKLGYLATIAKWSRTTDPAAMVAIKANDASVSK